jgi:ribosomal protein L11 methyltransferase
MSAPRRWLVLRARALPGVPDDGLVADALLALGGRAVQLDGPWWVTHLPEADVDTADALAWRDRVAGYLPPGGVEVETEWQEHGDWAELWKRGLEPRRITPRLVVTPSWCSPDVEVGDLVITLDPGMAFGNAEHGTTRGCLRLLDQVVRPGSRILDVGAGSAVLSIAAALMGADDVTAIEADPLAIPAAVDNVRDNGVEDRVTVVEARASARGLAARGEHDGVVANIQRGILEALLPGLAAAVRPGGWLILSGIPAEEWAEMSIAAERVGFRAGTVDEDGEWRSGLFERPSNPLEETF